MIANITQLVLASAHITNPNLTEVDFNNWYNTVLLPSFMQNHNASLGVRYKAIPRANATSPPKWEYLAVYKTHDAATAKRSFEHISVSVKHSITGIMGRDIGPDDVAIELSTWNPIQTFESLREKKGAIPAGRPKAASVVKIEPRAGDPDGSELEEWYHKQHLDMLSMLPNYRRSTRYRSADGSRPRWLAIHELDTVEIDAYPGEVMMNTDFTKSVMNGIQTFDATSWGYIFEAGNAAEKI